LPSSIWRSDGTSAGTVKVRDLPPSGCEPDLPGMAFVNRDGELVFLSTCDRRDLWRSDGTSAGTRVVKTFSRALVGPIVVAGTLAFFVADDGQGAELWTYDGSSARLVKDIVSGPGSPVIQTETMLALDGLLYFHDGDRNLWRSDGSAAGTVRIAQVFPGFPGFLPAEVAEVGDTTYFPADGALWASDGTLAGTRLIQDVPPSRLTVAGGILYFIGDDEAHGMELWALPVSDACDDDVIIDNGSPGTSFTGVWQVSGAPLHFGTNSLWNYVNSKYAPVYNFQADLVPGTYEVFEWHSSLSTRTRSARHLIAHAGGTASLLVDQSINPGRWNSLGTYSFSGLGTVTVRAEDSVRSTNADAIRFRCAARGRPVAVIDGIAPRPARGGEPVCFDGHGESALPIVAVEWLSSLEPGVLLGDEESFCLPDLVAGTHSILFRVQDSSGAWSLPAFETLEVRPEQCGFEVIIDNGGPGAAPVRGSWQVSESPGFFGTGSVWSRATSVVPSYRFEATLAAGTYEVFEWHTNWPTRSKSVVHQIDDAAPSLIQVTVDQSVNGGRWNSLGTYSLSGRTQVTIVASDTVKSTNADAIRFVCRTLSDS
jgi:ELWxxDGT repeat protein